MEHTSNSISKVSMYPLAATVFIICSTLTLVCGSNSTNSSSTYSLIYEFMAVPDFVWTEYGNYTPKVLCKVDVVLTECTKGRFNFSRYTGPYYQRNIVMLSAQISGLIGQIGEEMVITHPANNTWTERLVAIAQGEVCAVFVTMYRRTGSLPSVGHQQLDSSTTSGYHGLTTTTGPWATVKHSGPVFCPKTPSSPDKQQIICELRVQGMARAHRPQECDELYNKHCIISKCQIDDDTCSDRDLRKRGRNRTTCPAV